MMHAFEVVTEKLDRDANPVAGVQLTQVADVGFRRIVGLVFAFYIGGIGADQVQDFVDGAVE